MIYTNKNWRNRPTKVDNVPQNIDYIISIDENGTSNLRKVLQAKQAGEPAPDSERHFTVTACMFRTRDFESASEMVMLLKNKYWRNALFSYGDQQKRVCLHSKEIRGHKGAFHPEIIDYDSFILDLSQLIEDLPMTVYASHIDKVQHVNKYCYPDAPYDLCMNFVLERITKDLGDSETCVVILESRGAKEDMELLNQIKRLIDYGNHYASVLQLSKIRGVYFNPKWSKEDHCQKSYWSLEIADVCSYPIYKYFAHGKRDQAFDIVETKFRAFPRYRGRGLKSFP